LPPSYEAEPAQRYPVVYAHDGQNLFDEELSFAGEWRFDETMAELADEGIQALIVGIANRGEQRAVDYGDGREYVAFLAETLKPVIDAAFRTRPEPKATGTLGSSLAGLFSLRAFLSRPDLFGFAGVMSPALWWNDRAIFDLAEQARRRPGRLYVDVGGKEGARYAADTRRLVRLLERTGYGPEELLFVYDQKAAHHESAWAARLPAALRFLLGGSCEN
jgi:predicted alpha/beta superfamily hydrolase